MVRLLFLGIVGLLLLSSFIENSDAIPLRDAIAKMDGINRADSDTVLGKNLILNSSFECNGDSTLVGWNANCFTDPFHWDTNSTPPRGGKWSLRFGCGHGQEGPNITCKSTAGKHVYELKGWMRFQNNYISLSISHSQGIYFNRVSANTGPWKQYIIKTDTLDIQEDDSISVYLGSGSGPAFFGCSFDVIELIEY